METSSRLTGATRPKVRRCEMISVALRTCRMAFCSSRAICSLSVTPSPTRSRALPMKSPILFSGLLSSWATPVVSSSRLRRPSSGVLTRSRKGASDSSRSADAVPSGLCWSVMGHDSGRSGQAPFRLQPLQFLPLALQVSFQGDHLELAADDDLLEFLEVEDLLLQFRFGLLEVADDLLVGTHVAQDADGPDHLSVGVAQSRGVERRGDDFPAGAAGVEARVARHAPCHHLAQCGGELPCLLRADEA